MTLTRCTHSLIALAALLAASSAFAPRASAQTYKIDDGTPGYALSYGLPEDFCWMNHLTASGTVMLTSIEVVLGDTPDGWPVKLCVWRDLGGNGDPTQGLLLTQVSVLARNSGQQTLTQYAIPPTQVTGSFFVGAYLTTDGTLSMATLDPHTPTLGRAWFATAYGPGTFDPNFTGNWTWYAPPNIGLQGVFMLRANGVDGPTPELYCTAKVNSAGCTPLTSFTGTPSASAGAGFVITTTDVLNQLSGVFFYGLNGRQAVPFGGGKLCVASPLNRTPIQLSNGSPGGVDCSGAYSIDFNAWIASGADPALQPGVTVDGQFWSRDPGFTGHLKSIGLSRGVHFGIAP